MMKSDEPAEHRIRELLEAAGIPWQARRSELAIRYGVRTHPAYGWDVIEIETPCSIFPSLLWPLSVQVFPSFSPHMPATDFSGLVYKDNDARQNLSFAEKKITELLEKRASRDSNSNTLTRSWQFGAAEAKLIVWPPDLQSGPKTNPAQKREPRLKTACHLYINSGYRIACSALELEMLQGFRAISPIGIAASARSDVRCVPAHQSELEFVREPHAEGMKLRGLLGLSADGATLVFFGSQLYLLPKKDVLLFRVGRVRPAKGPGGSRLDVVCRTDYEELATKSLRITSADGVDDLNDIAASISEATGIPFELGDYDYDT